MIMLNSLVSIERLKGEEIPFLYNYYLAISVYSKLDIYQQNIKKLHNKNQVGIHTISNIISRKTRLLENGLDIPEGFFIIRSIDDDFENYVRLGLSLDPHLKIQNTIYKVKSVRPIEDKLDGKTEFNFKSLSPVLVRNFDDRKKFVMEESQIEENLNLVTKWLLLNEFNFSIEDVDNFNIEIKESKSRTVKVSSIDDPSSKLKAFELKGNISGDANIIKFIYHRGLGSKTGLGLGCWEVL
jgi:CRISPR-associated endoribonuclease Cas6